MSAREFDPQRLDVAAFADAGGRLEGRWPLAQFDRLVGSTVADASMAGEVRWHAEGERRRVRGGDSQTWLHLGAAATLPLECQRCLKTVATVIEVERRFLFVPGEEAAAQLDAQSEDDVLALTRALDLRALIEDELLLALPLVPRHEECPEPLGAGAADAPLSAGGSAPSPFAVLAALKRPGTLN
jgi:uncharacterized protein